MYNSAKFRSHFLRSEKNKHLTMKIEEIRPRTTTKISKRELEERLHELLQENLALKKMSHQQSDKIRVLSTKLQRAIAVRGEKEKEGDPKKMSYEDQKETILELKTVNIRQKEAIKRLQMQLSSAKQFFTRSSRNLSVHYLNQSLKDAPATSKSSKVLDSSRKESPTSKVAQNEKSERFSLKWPHLAKTPRIHILTTKSELGASLKKNILREGAERPNNECKDNKCKELIEDLKQKLSQLQEEQDKSNDEYRARISELEQKLKEALQQNKTLAGECASLAQQCELKERALRESQQKLMVMNLKCDDLSMKLSLERGKVDELMMQIKSVNLSAHVAKTIEEHLNQQVQKIIPTKEKTVWEEPKANDDSGFIEQNPSPKRHEGEDLAKKKSDQLLNRIFHLQSEIDAWSLEPTQDERDDPSMHHHNTNSLKKENTETSHFKTNSSADDKKRPLKITQEVVHKLKCKMKTDEEKGSKSSSLRSPEENFSNGSSKRKLDTQDTSCEEIVQEQTINITDYRKINKFSDNTVIHHGSNNVNNENKLTNDDNDRHKTNNKIKVHNEDSNKRQEDISSDDVKEKNNKTIKTKTKSTDKEKPKIETNDPTQLSKNLTNNGEIAVIPDQNRKKKLRNERKKNIKSNWDVKDVKKLHIDVIKYKIDRTNSHPIKTDFNELRNRKTLHIYDYSADTDNEISAMSELPHEPETQIRSTLSPGEQRPAEILFTYSDSRVTTTADSLTLSEGEILTDGRSASLVVERTNNATSLTNANKVSSAPDSHNIESAMEAIKEELARCKELLNVRKREIESPLMPTRTPGLLF